MAKTESLPAAALADRVVVQLHCEPGGSPAQAEVLVSGVRVAYVTLAPPFPVIFLTPEYLEKLGIDKLRKADVKAIVAKARAEAEALAKRRADDDSEIAEILAGQHL